MKSNVVKLVSAIALTLTGACAQAVELSEIVITATRTATPLDELAVPVIVIHRADIERSLAADVAMLLAGLPGLEIARTGGPGQPASVFLRGTNSNHTSVLIDGVRINPGTIGGAQLANIQPESIERIEIIKGARSSLYGTDAIGGVINIITRSGGAPGASLFASDGRYGTQVVAGDASGALTEKLGAGGSFAYQRSDGYPPRQDSLDPGDYHNRSANARLRYAWDDSLTLSAQLWRAEGKSAYANFGPPATENFLNASYATTAEWRDAAEGRNARIVASRVTADVRQIQSPDFDRTRRDALDAQYSWRLLDSNEITVGAIAANEHTQSLSFGSPYDRFTHTLLGFTQDRWHSGANDLLLSLGYSHHEAFGAHTTWNAEYGRELVPALRATAALGTAFHAPESSDLYGVGGNPALRPETSRQGQVGLRWQPAGATVLRLQLFDNRVNDLIQSNPPTYVPYNTGRARIRGAEAEYEWHTDVWHVQGAYTLQDPRDLSADAPLVRRARRNVALGAQYSAGRLYATTHLQLTGARAENVYDALGNPHLISLGGYTMLNLGLGYEFTRSWSVQLKIDNALDRRYEFVRGYNTARRSLTLATRYHMR